MVGYQTLPRDDIAAILALHKAGQAIRAISNQTSVSVRKGKRYTRCVADSAATKLPPRKKHHEIPVKLPCVP